ncbi:YegP family protein [Arthrobacter sp. HS15c]|uniref:YegP family protein n=1 Tax=Arthrobacter sp. HS15c TaxID=3230279 RepID=UPI003467D3F8
MAGMFELYMDAESYFRFRLTAPDGTVMAVSKAFDTKTAAVAGIAEVREYAGMGHITDLSPTARKAAQPDIRDVPVTQVHEVRRIPAADLHSHARNSRQPALGPRWAGAI